MKRPIWLMFCAMVSIGIMAGATFAAPGKKVSDPNVPAPSASEKKQRKIVIFRDDAREVEREAAVQKHGGQVRRKLSRFNGVAVHLSEKEVKGLRREKHVKAIYDDLKVLGDAITFTPVEPPAGEAYSWAQQYTGVPAVHQLIAGLPLAQVRVAVLDTGLDIYHPELQQYIVGGFNTLSGLNPHNYQDYNGHGTHMAGLMTAAINGQGIIGVATQVHLLGVKVLDRNGKGYLSDLLEGLEWVRQNNVQVVNMSLSVNQPSPLLAQAMQDLHNAGVILVAAVGNRCKVATATDSGGDDSGGDDSGGDDSGGDDSGGDDSGGDDSGGDNASGSYTCDVTLDPLQGSVKYPARYPEVIAIGATDAVNNIARYSRFGPEVTLVAPGGSSLNEKMLSTIHGARYAYGSGTSQATAYVSGTIALMLQLVPTLSPAEVLDLLQTTALDLGFPPEQQGAGLLNVQGIVQLLLAPPVPQLPVSPGLPGLP